MKKKKHTLQGGSRKNQKKNKSGKIFKMEERYLAFIIYFVTCICRTLSDTPVNCTYEEIKGSWIFYESARIHDGTIDCKEFGQSKLIG